MPRSVSKKDSHTGYMNSGESYVNMFVLTDRLPFGIQKLHVIKSKIVD